MPAVSPIRGLVTPSGGEPTNGPGALDALGDSIEAAMGLMGLRQILVFTANGTFLKASYPWLSAVRYRVVGGGGGAGGCPATGASQSSSGNSGGGGGYAEGLVPVASLATSVTVTVGAAGAAGASGAAAGNGGDSSFGPHGVATGGAGGGICAAVTTGPTPVGATIRGASGVGTVGDLLLRGEVQQYGVSPASGALMLIAPGAGSGCGMGPGGVIGFAALGAAPSSGYGGGGGGSTNGASTAARAGVAGAAGVVIVELYG